MAISAGKPVLVFEAVSRCVSAWFKAMVRDKPFYLLSFYMVHSPGLLYPGTIHKIKSFASGRSKRESCE